MVYESRHLRRQKVRYNSTNLDNPLSAQLTVAGAKVTPASATITIYAPGNSTALVSAAAMTVSGTLLTYSVTTTTVASWPVEEGYRAELAITVGSGGSAVVYSRVVIFDVCKFVLVLGITRDQLLALDENILAADHAGDEDFSEVIEAVRDELQLLLETKAIDGGHAVENMIVDASRVAIPARRKVLSTIWRNKGDITRAEHHEAEFGKLWTAVMAGVRFDKDQDGEEEEGAGRIDGIRLVF
jgi:hypothetical protein